MKCPKDAVRLFSVIVSLMILFVIIGCSDDGGPSGPKLPADPGPGNLAGVIVETINGRALAGVTVSVGSISTSTDSDGIFRLDGVGEGVLAVMIEGGDIYTRRAAVDTAAGRSVLLDAIEVNSGFNLEFYREIARGNHPEERDLDMFVTFRWVNPTPPTFYIATNSDATLDGVVDQETINTVRNVIKEVVAPFTGNFYSSVSIETREFAKLDDLSDIPDNSFVFIFDDSLISYDALGLTVSEPDYPTPTVNAINKTIIFLLDFNLFYALGGTSLRLVTAHEMGHGFGFWHTSLFPSIMSRAGLNMPPDDRLMSAVDTLHMGIVYKRPPGNTDIDNDPVPGAKRIGESFGLRVHIDTIENPPELSPDVLESLQLLRDKSIVEQYINK